jgi:hypothetical protein
MTASAVMAGLVPTIYVFNPIKSLEDLILRSRRSLHLEGASREHWSILRDGAARLLRMRSECFEAPKTWMPGTRSGMKRRTQD